MTFTDVVVGNGFSYFKKTLIRWPIILSTKIQSNNYYSIKNQQFFTKIDGLCCSHSDSKSPSNRVDNSPVQATLIMFNVIVRRVSLILFSCLLNSVNV